MRTRIFLLKSSLISWYNNTQKPLSSKHPHFYYKKAMSQALNFGKSVSDNGWGMFTVFLKYKLEESGKKLIKVDRFFASSQICSCCGYKNTETKNLSVRAWDCPECGTHHDRDTNAAVNIKNEGMRLLCS